ncbi:hypothetical protein Hanom_Chr13g01185291 [Helianthus anomalus]
MGTFNIKRHYPTLLALEDTICSSCTVFGYDSLMFFNFIIVSCTWHISCFSFKRI